jgi:hypothetical protein
MMLRTADIDSVLQHKGVDGPVVVVQCGVRARLRLCVRV